ncbi:unnamed protein product, partial [Rangifer tarandus platyrhynchus]
HTDTQTPTPTHTLPLTCLSTAFSPVHYRCPGCPGPPARGAPGRQGYSSVSCLSSERPSTGLQ